MCILKKISSKLSILEGFYDYIRIVDPINKLVFDLDSLQYSNIPCYKHFENESPCKNCVCSKAFANNDIFVKLENKGKDILLTLSCPIDIEDTIYIVEVFKNLDKYMSNNSFDSNELINFRNIINKLNDAVVNRTYSNSKSL